MSREKEPEIKPLKKQRMMTITITFKDVAPGKQSIICTPPFKELMDMRMNGDQSDAADIALFAMHQIWLEQKKHKGANRIKSIDEIVMEYQK